MRVANEARVGIVVVLALVVLIAGYFYLRGIGLGADLYYVRLSNAATIAAGNDVRLQGVKVGQVQDVTLDAETQKPLLTIAIKRSNPPFRLLKQYTYAVMSSAIIGENYVDIRGPFDPNAEVYLANNRGQVIPGTGSAGIAGITDAATLLAKDMRTTLAKFNITIDRINKGVLSYDNQIKLAKTLDSVTQLTQKVGQGFGPNGIRFGFGDPRAQHGLNETLASSALAAQEAHQAARNMTRLTEQFGGVLSENRGQLRQLLISFNDTAENVAALTATLDFTLRKGGFTENAGAAFKSLRRAAENVEAGTAGFKTLGTDPETQKSLRATLTALRQSTEALQATAESIKGLTTDPELRAQLTGTLKTLNATAGVLQNTTENLRDTTAGFKNVIGDPKVQEDLKATVTALRGTMETAQGTLEATRSAAERINSLLGGRRKSSSTTTGSGEGVKSAPPQHAGYAPGGVDFTYRRLTNGNRNTGRNFGDLTLNTELFGGPFRLGLANIGDGTDLTLQTGKFLGRNGAIRYGVYRSKLGIGADLHSGRFSLEGNLYDPNRRSFNIYGGVKITPEVEVLIGREHIRGLRTNSIGVRITP